MPRAHLVCVIAHAGAAGVLRKAMSTDWDAVTGHLEHRVTFSETDGLGFVHHRCAAVWFEQVRETFFLKLGVSAAAEFKKGFYLAVRQLNTRYDSFIAYEDVVSIRVALTKLARVSMDFHYRVDNLTTKKLAVRGHTNLGAVEGKPDKGPPQLGRLRFDRTPFQAMVVSADEFYGAPQGAWHPPRWEHDGSMLSSS